jgi:DNA-binding response OmpR family regulator
LVLLDVVIPGSSSREVHDFAMAEHPRIALLYTSGYAPRGSHTRFVLEEGLPLLTKPYGPSSLLRRVRAILDEHSVR